MYSWLFSTNSLSLNNGQPCNSQSGPCGGGGLVLLGAPANVSGRRHSHNLRVNWQRNRSAPVTPLNRSVINVNEKQ